MIEKTIPYNKRPKVYARSDTKSVDLVMKRNDFNVKANGNFGSGRFGLVERKFHSSRGSKVKPLSSTEAIELIAYQRKQISESAVHTQKKLLPIQMQKNSPEKTKQKFSNANEHQVGFIPVMKKKLITEVIGPREKVLKAVRLFRLVFEELDRQKAVRCGESRTATSRVDYDSRTILMDGGKQVNAEKMIGPVPGIEVGDEFQFKAELNLIGLHFYITGGIDYMNKGNLKLATSIVASEGNGYDNIFESDMLIYSGQGGNVTSNDHKLVEDQKLVAGNLALANSMSEKTPVRVIRGMRRPDKRGKDYVYDGLYLVEEYWQQRGPLGNVLLKFKLQRVPGQPFVNLKSRKAY